MTCAKCGTEVLPGLGFCLKCTQEGERGAELPQELEVTLGPPGSPPREKVLTLLAALAGPVSVDDNEQSLRITGAVDVSLERLARWLSTRGAQVQVHRAGESGRWRFGYQPTPLAAGLVLVPLLTIGAAVFTSSLGVVTLGVVVSALLVLHVFGPRPGATHVELQPQLPGLDTIDATLGEHLRLVRTGLTDPDAIDALVHHVRASHALMEVIRADGEHLSSEVMKANDQFLAVELREATRLAADADRQRKMLAGGVVSEAAARAERRRQASLRTLAQLTTHLAQSHQRLLGLSSKDATTSLLNSMAELRGLVVRSREEAGTHQP